MHDIKRAPPPQLRRIPHREPTEVVSVAPSERAVVPAGMPFNIDVAPAELVWQADHRRGAHLKNRHYAVMGALIAIGGLLAWWQSSMLTFAVIIVCVGAWEVYERWGGQASVRIGDEGVHVNDMHIPHAELTSYDIYRMPDGHLELSLRTARRMLPRLRIPLHDQNPDVVALVLAAHVPREKHELPLLDALLRASWRKK